MAAFAAGCACNVSALGGVLTWVKSPEVISVISSRIMTQRKPKPRSATFKSPRMRCVGVAHLLPVSGSNTKVMVISCFVFLTDRCPGGKHQPTGAPRPQAAREEKALPPKLILCAVDASKCFINSLCGAEAAFGHVV